MVEVYELVIFCDVFFNNFDNKNIIDELIVFIVCFNNFDYVKN